MCVCILHTEAYCILYTVYRKDNPKSHDVSLLLVSFYKFQPDEGRADEGAGCEWRCRREETLTLHVKHRGERVDDGDNKVKGNESTVKDDETR